MIPHAAVWRRGGWWLALLLAPITAAAADVITRAIDVRNLSPAEAEKGREIHLRGVVVFQESSAIFLQDETSTTFFKPMPGQNVAIGDEIEIRGCTRMGLYLPGIGEVDMKVLRRGLTPRDIPATYDDVVFARYHYRRVAIEGIVRSVEAESATRSVLRLAMGARNLDVRIQQPPGPGKSLVDCHVEIKGLAAGFISDRRLVDPYVRVQSWDDVHVLEPAPPPEQIPRLPAYDLLAFRPSGRLEHRVAVQGKVTAAFNQTTLFLIDGATAFAAVLVDPADVAIGDVVELLGFPEMAHHVPAVVNAQLVRRAPGPPHPPVTVESPSDLSGKHNGQLVSLSARVLDAFKTPEGTTLVLPGKDRTIQVQIPAATVDAQPGALVSVTGICQIEGQPGNSFSSIVGTVRLRARGAGDVFTLQRASWWTPQRLAVGIGLLAGITLLAGLWIAVLRRQVRRQTNALRHRIEAEAALEERQRIAREFHDTLEQELAGVSLRLDALATRVNDTRGKDLAMASRNLVSRIQSETRDLISDLRDPAEVSGDLGAALGIVAARQAGESGRQVRLDLPPVLPTLPPAVVHDLRMIARESVNNALKHGAATDILIALRVAPGQLELTVTDNGTGFDASAVTRERRGHFGCAGMRERARKLGATIAWQSTPGTGTTVQVVYPLTANPSESPAPGPAPVVSSFTTPASPQRMV